MSPIPDLPVSPSGSTARRWFLAPVFRWSIGIMAAVFAGAALFELLDVSVFKRIGLPHEFCYVREPGLIALHVSADLLIGAAYVSISVTLAYLVYKTSRNIPFNWVFLAFGLFIISCGLTHFMEVWVIWEPVYWLSGYIKVITASASIATAAALLPLVPRIFRLVESAREGERRRVEVEQLNHELERFNYTVAHDLRAPLRGIVGFGHALRDDFGPHLPTRAQEYIGRMERAAERMDALVTDLLRYATVGRQELNLGPVSIEEAVRGALLMLDAEIRQRRAEIIVAPGLPSVLADATLLQVVLQNLLGNSLKFVAPGNRPRIEISAERANQFVTIQVDDHGIGIPAEMRERIFRMFERLNPSYEGTGIGLAIVHRAIERMNGRLGVAERPGGGGTRFWITLPAGPALTLPPAVGATRGIEAHRRAG